MTPLTRRNACPSADVRCPVRRLSEIMLVPAQLGRVVDNATDLFMG
ncbi:MAG TPA: hypothetical protein VMG39_04580 [Pseudolabrys sp.]|nr:hypothetical protein [Pseudolabrys sp.]